MKNSETNFAQTEQLGDLVKIGLIRELFRRNQITGAQFEQLMRLQRA